MRTILFYLYLILIYKEVVSVDTTICPKGFSITAANVCDFVLGPCATTDYVASIPTFATTCLTCFDDASLFTVTNFAGVVIKRCVPNVCTALSTGAHTGYCTFCATGYIRTVNASCILNGGTSSSTSSTNSSATSTPSSTQTATNGTNGSDNASNVLLPISLVVCALIWLCFKLVELYKTKKS